MYDFVIGGESAILSADVARSGVKIVVGDRAGKVGGMNFTCAPTAYWNAMRALGIPMTARDAQGVSDSGVLTTRDGRDSRATGRYTDDPRMIREASDVSRYRGVETDVFSLTTGAGLGRLRLETVIQRMRRADASVAVVATRTPAHAWALILDATPDGEPLVIDNGGWEKPATWRGSNITRAVAVRRRDGIKPAQVKRVSTPATPETPAPVIPIARPRTLAATLSAEEKRERRLQQKREAARRWRAKKRAQGIRV